MSYLVAILNTVEKELNPTDEQKEKLKIIDNKAKKRIMRAYQSGNL